MLNKSRNGRAVNSAYPPSSPVHNERPVKFMRVVGPQAKGLAELAIVPFCDPEKRLMDKWDYLNASDLMTVCCRGSPSDKPDSKFNFTNDYILKGHNQPTVVTQQPNTVSIVNRLKCRENS